jgi:hypothetical protein
LLAGLGRMFAVTTVGVRPRFSQHSRRSNLNLGFGTLFGF